jgi:hypothetical protein
MIMNRFALPSRFGFTPRFPNAQGGPPRRPLYPAARFLALGPVPCQPPVYWANRVANEQAQLAAVQGALAIAGSTPLGRQSSAQQAQRRAQMNALKTNLAILTSELQSDSKKLAEAKASGCSS